MYEPSCGRRNFNVSIITRVMVAESAKVTDFFKDIKKKNKSFVGVRSSKIEQFFPTWWSNYGCSGYR